MKCPFCGCDDTQVKDSRNADDNTAIRRRRECPECGSEKIVRQPNRIGTINAGGSCAMKSSCPAAGGGCCHGKCSGKH